MKADRSPHQLVNALRLDLVGPENDSELATEVLPQAPSRWYLTGFLVPLEASEAQRQDETARGRSWTSSEARSRKPPTTRPRPSRPPPAGPTSPHPSA